MNTAVTDELVEQIVRRVVELLREDAPLLDAADVSRRLGRSREWVYRHADELGAVRLGEGERPRLGFEPAKVAAFLDACGTGRRTEGPAKPAAKRTMPRVVAPVNGQPTSCPFEGRRRSDDARSCPRVHVPCRRQATPPGVAERSGRARSGV